MPTFTGKKTINAYEFSYRIEVDRFQPSLQKRGWPAPGMETTFRCLGEVKLDKRPVFAWAKDWWMSYVQTITYDAVLFSYSNKVVYCVRCDAPIKDGDNTLSSQ